MKEYQEPTIDILSLSKRDDIVCMSNRTNYESDQWYENGDSFNKN